MGCGRRRRSCRSASIPTASTERSRRTGRNCRRCTPTTCSRPASPRPRWSSTGASLVHRMAGKGSSMCPAESLLYVTQVAPYRDGPAGAHSVLEQSATAVAELADHAGLRFERCTDVRTIDGDAIDRAAVVGLFTIGETPWSADQRASLLSQLRGGFL